MKTIEVTKLEKIALEAIGKGMYAELGFSDVGPTEISDLTKIPMTTLRGVLSSLTKKGYIDIDTRDDEMDVEDHIIYLHSDMLGIAEVWIGEKYGGSIIEPVILIEK